MYSCDYVYSSGADGSPFHFCDMFTNDQDVRCTVSQGLGLARIHSEFIYIESLLNVRLNIRGV